jgi:hypothetical protein
MMSSESAQVFEDRENRCGYRRLRDRLRAAIAAVRRGTATPRWAP